MRTGTTGIIPGAVGIVDFHEMLLAGVLGFFALHTLLWLNRSLAERRQRRSGAGEAQ